MRGEGFNPEIAKEAGREAATKEIGRRERSFLDSLRQGAERHKLALAFLFSGALAESMSGTARAQEVSSEDGPEHITEAQLEKSERDCRDRFDDIRAPFIFIEGFEEKYRIMQTQTFIARQQPGRGIEKSVTNGPLQVRSNDLTQLQDKRLIVTQGIAQLAVERFRKIQPDENTGSSAVGSVREDARAETAVYASDGAENDIEGARSFSVKGWGASESQALLNALEHAAAYLGIKIKSEAVRADEQSVISGKGGRQVSGKSDSGAMIFSSSQTASVIEGFSILKKEKHINNDGRSEYVVSIEGLGSTLIMEPFQEK